MSLLCEWHLASIWEGTTIIVTTIKTNIKATKVSCRGSLVLQLWARYSITLYSTACVFIISFAIISLA